MIKHLAHSYPRLLTGIAGLALIAVVVPSYAQAKEGERKERPRDMAKAADTNGDGLISKAEHDAMTEKRFSRMDMNSDGVLNQTDRDLKKAEMDEMKKKGQERRAEQGMRADANGDGSIDLAEFKAQSDEMFARMDSNSDGSVSEDERKAARQAMRQRWQERKGGDSQ